MYLLENKLQFLEKQRCFIGLFRLKYFSYNLYFKDFIKAGEKKALVGWVVIVGAKRWSSLLIVTQIAPG